MTHRKLLLFALMAILALPAQVQAQGINGRARTYVSYIQIRDLVLDSVPEGNVDGEGAQRALSDGTPVSCGVDYCQYYRSGSSADFVPLLQDLELNAWTGVTGLRAYAHLRARAPLGDRAWPRSEEEFEALAAYLEYRRSFYRIQAGRIWETTALGFYNYDGGSLALRLPSNLDVSIYGGLSLVRGLNQLHHSDLISAVESLEPREDAYLGGIHARWRPLSSLATSFTYQRERTIHSGELYSERVAGSARVLVKRATVDVEVKYDLAAEEVNLARLKVAAPLGAGFRGSGEIRKYVPFFELWTIWGAFSPVGYEEVRARLDWTSASGRFGGHAYGSYRQFGDTDAEAPAGYEIRDNSWRTAVGGRYAIRDNLILDGEYRYDVGYGASRSGGDVSLQRFFGNDTYLAVRGTAFETFSEFRVGSGQVVGGGVQGAMPLGPATIQAGAMIYRHTENDRPSLLDLNQARLNLTLDIPIGKDPGLVGRGNR